MEDDQKNQKKANLTKYNTIRTGTIPGHVVSNINEYYLTTKEGGK